MEIQGGALPTGKARLDGKDNLFIPSRRGTFPRLFGLCDPVPIRPDQIASVELEQHGAEKKLARNLQVTFVVELADGRRFIASGKHDDYLRLKSIVLQNETRQNQAERNIAPETPEDKRPAPPGTLVFATAVI